MARAWKRKADKGKAGTPWMLTYTDWKLVDGKWVSRERSRMGYTDKRETLALGTRLEDEARQRRDGLRDDRDERRGLEKLRPLSEHIDEYEQALRRKGSNPKHVAQSIGYIRTAADALKWEAVGQIRADALVRHLGERREEEKWGPRTFNARLTAFKSFSRWLMLHDRLTSDPLVSAKKLRESADLRRKRRPLTEAESEALIAAAESGESVTFRLKGKGYTLTGRDRAMLYRLLLGTGLRAGEAASLTRRSFDLRSEDGPVVTVAAAYSKRRRQDVQPIPAALAAVLGPWFDDKPQGASLWPMPHKAAERLLVPDLRRARARWLLEAPKGKARRERLESDTLCYRDNAGRYADLHSLRHSYITRLGIADVSLTVAQRLARHSTPTLTANVYTHVRLADQRAALARAFQAAPSPAPETEAARATGTDGAVVAADQDPCAQRPAQRGTDRAGLRLAGCDTGGAGSTDSPAPGSVARKSLESREIDAAGHGRARPRTSARGNAPRRTRTFNPLIKSQLLCQLS